MEYIILLILIIILAYILKRKEKFDGYKTAVSLLNQGHNIFVTGGAGTGKSYILRKLKQRYGEKLCITSTTGISALNVNGQTIHSWAGIGIGTKPIHEIVEKIKNKPTLYQQIAYTKMLAIDEVSMLNNKTMDYINEVLKQIHNNNKAFGGIQVLLFGDFLQLPPVNLGVEGIDFCFNSKTWKELNIKPIILKEVKRQTELDYVNALNNIRVGKITPKDSKLFIDKEKEFKNLNTDGILHIFGTNLEADEYNTKCFEQIESEPYTYYSKDTLYKYDKQENPTEIAINEDNLSYYEKKIFKKFNDDCKAPSELTLKLGTRVMLIKNIDIHAGLVNGSCGKIIALLKDSIRVKFDNNLEFDVEKTEFISYSDGLPKIKREQYPLRLAYGITIHKSQGMTFDNLVVDLNNVFSGGQAYVALSRTRTLSGLVLRNYLPGKVTINQEVVEFYNNLENPRTPISSPQNQIYTPQNNDILQKNNIEKNQEKVRVKTIENHIYTNNILEKTSYKNIEEIITEHIYLKKELTINYLAYNGESTIRKIVPIKLYTAETLNKEQPMELGTWTEGTKYLKAFCKLRNEERFFRLDRIKVILE